MIQNSEYKLLNMDVVQTVLPEAGGIRPYIFRCMFDKYDKAKYVSLTIEEGCTPSQLKGALAEFSRGLEQLEEEGVTIINDED